LGTRKRTIAVEPAKEEGRTVIGKDNLQGVILAPPRGS